MAFGRNCYCCGQIPPAELALFYCKECLNKLRDIFDANADGIVCHPTHMEHCIFCGEWEARRIVWTGNTAAFFDPHNEGLPICEVCVRTELEKLSL